MYKSYRITLQYDSIHAMHILLDYIYHINESNHSILFEETQSSDDEITIWYLNNFVYYQK